MTSEEKNSNRSLTVAQICLANARRDEAHPEYRYGKREEKYFQLIREHAADVYCLKELRPCLNEEGTATYSVHDLLTRLKSQRGELEIAAMAPQCLTKTGTFEYNPFYLAQLYNAKKFAVYAWSMMPLFPSNLFYLRVTYMPRDQNGVPQFDRCFDVDSMHFPMGNDDKTKITEHLAEEGVADRSIRIGDFNFFRDDADHAKHLAFMRSGFGEASCLTDSDPEAEMNMKNERGEWMYGTFWPFPYDKPPVELAAPWVNAPNTSLLDYAWLSKDWPVEDIDVKVVEGGNRDKLPWDHLPFFVTIKLSR